MKSVYFQLVGGAAGDMLLSALVDLGVPLSYLRRELKKIPLEFSIGFKRIKGGHAPRRKLQFKGTAQFDYKGVTGLIKKSGLDKDIKDKALAVYAEIFAAEKKVHKVRGDNLHFHHLGQLDAVLEICGFFVALKFLAVEAVSVSVFPLSAPAPATLELLKEKTVRPSDFGYESITPTAAALLRTARQRELDFVFQSKGTGWGECGRKDYLVVYLFKEEFFHDKIIKIETNIDDMNPQIFESVFDALYKAGALEVYLESVIMKKSRPAFVLNVLTSKDKFIKLRDIIFKQTTTFGLRYREYDRDKLDYQFIEKKTSLGKIRCRVSRGKFQKQQPEYRDCLKAAIRHNLPLLKVETILK